MPRLRVPLVLLLSLVGFGCGGSAGSAQPPRRIDARAALGLGPSATVDQVVALERLCKRGGAFVGQGCGEARGPDGRSGSAYWNHYNLVIPGADDGPVPLRFGHHQRDEHPVFSLAGPGFSYRREGHRFVLEGAAR